MSRFEDKPSKDMGETGVQSEALSLTDRYAKVIIVFLMNLHDRCGMLLGELQTSCGRLCFRNVPIGQGSMWTWKDSFAEVDEEHLVR